MTRPINRITPTLSAGSFKTYQIRQPLSTHFRKATCKEFECLAFQNGWVTKVAIDSPQADYIRNRSGRRFREVVEAGLCIFTFYPGQTCFAGSHSVPLERPQIFIVKDGDWRGNPRYTEPRIHRRAADWVDDFGEHQQRLADDLNKG